MLSISGKALLAVLLLVSLLGYTEAFAQKTVGSLLRKNTVFSAPLVYEHPRDHYRISLPSGWKARRSDTDDSQEFRHDTTQASIEIMCDHTGDTLDVLREQTTRSVQTFKNDGVRVAGVVECRVGKFRASALWMSSSLNNDTQFKEYYGVLAPAGKFEILCSYTNDDDQKRILGVLNELEFLAPSDGTIFRSPNPLPRTGYVNEYLGLRWNGQAEHEQCGWAAYQFAEWYLGHPLPIIDKGGVQRLWHIETPGYRKVPNTTGDIPSPGALLLWDKRMGKGKGHIAVVLSGISSDRRVRVIDCNWGNDRRGQIHDVSLNDSRIRGWLVRE